MTTTRQRSAELIQPAWSADPLRRGLSDFARERARPLYLVGGAVRDVVLGREIGDWDLAGPGAVELARRWAREENLRLVALHEELPTARVITSPGDPNGFVDFSDLRADNIEDDLRARDFTINAIAWDLRGADQTLDPTDGLADLRGALIRATSPTCLEDDPLRTLRAFRLAAELGFGIEQQTGEWVGQCGARISEVSGERVGQEMFKLFAAPHCADAVQLAEDLGTLHHFIPPAARMRGVSQGGYHHLDVMGHTLLALHEAERIINEPALALPRSAESIKHYLADDQRRAAVRMAALLHDIGKPVCRTVDEDGRVRFAGHADESAIIFSRLAKVWTLPGVIRREVVAMIRLHLRPLQLINEGLRKLAEGQAEEKALTLVAIRRIMLDAEPAGIGLLLLACADRAACRGPSSDFEHRGQVMAMLDSMLTRYLSWLGEQRSLPRLVTGHDLMREFDLPPGEPIGELLDAIARAQEDGQVKTREDALDVAGRALRRKKW